MRVESVKVDVAGNIVEIRKDDEVYIKTDGDLSCSGRILAVAVDGNLLDYLLIEKKAKRLIVYGNAIKSIKVLRSRK